MTKVLTLKLLNTCVKKKPIISVKIDKKNKGMKNGIATKNFK